MKKGNITSWEIKPELEGLLFFAQRIDELLFNYTLDSFKYYALNTSMLVKEALSVLKQVSGEVIDDMHLSMVIEELNWSASKDLVVKEILNDKFKIYFPLTDILNKEDLKLKLQILSNKISLHHNIEKNKILLIKAISERKKRDIDKLSRNFVTSLINAGFNHNHIYFRVQNFFFNKKNAITSVEQIKEFINFFEPKRKEFKVVFIVSRIFDEMKDTLSRFDVEINDQYQIEDCNDFVRNFLKRKKASQRFLECKKVIALDEQSAKIKAESLIRTIANYFSFFHHKIPPNWSWNAVVIGQQTPIYLDKLVSPMAKSGDMKPDEAGGILNKFLLSFKLQEQSSIRRFNKVIELHGQAIESNSRETQILNLWIAFETLFGDSKNSSKIKHIIESLTPILSYHYFNRIFSEISESIKIWDESEFDKIQAMISPSELDETEKVTLFIVSKEYEAERNDLYSKLDNFPLLRFRIFEMSNGLKNSDKIYKFIQIHEKRIKWHIRRIYRARNSIVHQGKIESNIDILIENAHNYLDSFMDYLILMNLQGRQITSIDQAIKDSQLLKNEWVKYLKNNTGIECNKDTTLKLLMDK